MKNFIFYLATIIIVCLIFNFFSNKNQSKFLAINAFNKLEQKLYYYVERSTKDSGEIQTFFKMLDDVLYEISDKPQELATLVDIFENNPYYDDNKNDMYNKDIASICNTVSWSIVRQLASLQTDEAFDYFMKLQQRYAIGAGPSIWYYEQGYRYFKKQILGSTDLSNRLINRIKNDLKKDETCKELMINLKK